VEDGNELSVKMFEDIGEPLPKTIIRPATEIEYLIKNGALILL
jgi:hypothetical protein